MNVNVNKEQRRLFETILVKCHENLLKSREDYSYLSDMKIVCSDGTLYYNKLLLSICLPYLQFIEFVDCEIIWPELSVQEISMLLSFKVLQHNHQTDVDKESETVGDFNNIPPVAPAPSSDPMLRQVSLQDPSLDVTESSLDLNSLFDSERECCTDVCPHSSSPITQSSSPELPPTISCRVPEKESKKTFCVSGKEFIQEQSYDSGDFDSSVNEEKSGLRPRERSPNLEPKVQANAHMCQECGLCYASKEKLKNHFKWKHFKTDFHFKCDVCHQTFQRKCLLKRHYVKHKQPSLKCEYCDKTFKQQSHLNVHMKTAHKDEMVGKSPRFECPTCRIVFNKKSNLTRHLSVHKSEEFNAFQCLLCDKSYKLQFSLERHLQSHVGDGYKCDRCNKQIGRKDNLLRHVLKCKK